MILIVLLWVAQADARTLFGEPSGEYWDWPKARDYQTYEDHTHEAPHSHASVSTTGRGMGSDVEQWRALVETYFGDATSHALCIMRWESGGNPNALSYANARGLMQIHAPSWAAYYGVTYAQLYDPATNIRLAHLIYVAAGGWHPWNVAWRC